tara:strand:- start:62 stop:307 length:246 start_codon:yes stop_codon:yes gene_type:complete
MKTKAQELGITNFPYKEYGVEGRETYHERSDGVWYKWEYDKYGNETYYENSNGWWMRSKFNSKDDETYYENSDGYIEYYII